MGAWGHASFENDDALDWVNDLLASSDTSALELALAAVTAEAATSSELQKLWEENDEDYPNWRAALDGIAVRLRPY